jgi:hypothetical protein
VNPTPPIHTISSHAVELTTARSLFDLALQKETDLEGIEDADMARQQAINQLAGSSTILPQKVLL